MVFNVRKKIYFDDNLAKLLKIGCSNSNSITECQIDGKGPNFTQAGWFIRPMDINEVNGVYELGLQMSQNVYNYVKKLGILEFA